MAKKNPFENFKKGPLMFSWCPVSKAWTARNAMLGVNLRFHDNKDTEVVRIRLDQDAFDDFKAKIKALEYDGRLLRYEEIPGDDDVILPEGWGED